MARVHSFLAALSLAALVGLTTVKPVHAAQSITPDAIPAVWTVSRNGFVNITGTSVSTSGNATDVIVDLLGITGLSYSSPTLVPGTNQTLTKIIAASNATLGLHQNIKLSFITNGGVEPSAFIDVRVVDVPEPGVVAFGVIAAGSVLGLVARRRKTA